MNKKLFGFTLAEVLITLAIIGVVAALTLPTLLTNYQKHETETRLKRTYAILQQAINMSVATNGDVAGWEWNDRPTDDGARTQYFWSKYLAPYLQISKSCIPASLDCFADEVKKLNGTLDGFVYSSNRHVAYVLNDGTSIYSWAGGDAYDAHAHIVIDLNGKKGPNTFGKDIFRLTLLGHPNPEVDNSATLTKKDKDGNTLESDIAIAPERRYYLNFSGYNPSFTVEDYLNPNFVSVSGDGKTETKIEACSKESTGLSCGAAIQANDWKIPKDYPW